MRSVKNTVAREAVRLRPTRYVKPIRVMDSTGVCMSYGSSSFKGFLLGSIVVAHYGDTRSFDYSSYHLIIAVLSLC